MGHAPEEAGGQLHLDDTDVGIPLVQVPPWAPGDDGRRGHAVAAIVSAASSGDTAIKSQSSNQTKCRPSFGSQSATRTTIPSSGRTCGVSAPVWPFSCLASHMGLLALLDRVGGSSPRPVFTHRAGAS